MKIHRHLTLAFFVPAALALAAVTCATVNAAVPPISWGSPQTIAGDSDVSTNGSLVYAFTFGGTSAPSQATVNGVTFLPFTIPGGFVTSATTGNAVISESPGFLFASNTFGSGSAPFSNLSSSDQTLLGSGGYANVPPNITVTLGGLTSGQDYLVQWWTNNSANLSPQFGGGFTNTTATIGTTSVTLIANTTGQLGGLGQYAIGTFTALSTLQTFVLSEPSGGFNPLINALQVRAVPEPSTYAMVLAGPAGGGVSLWRRRLVKYGQRGMKRADRLARTTDRLAAPLREAASRGALLHSGGRVVRRIPLTHIRAVRHVGQNDRSRHASTWWCCTGGGLVLPLLDHEGLSSRERVTIMGLTTSSGQVHLRCLLAILCHAVHVLPAPHRSPFW